jgi:hypothetical protein
MKHNILRTPYLGTDSLRTQYSDEDQSKAKIFSESQFFAITYPSKDHAARVIKTFAAHPVGESHRPRRCRLRH